MNTRSLGMNENEKTIGRKLLETSPETGLSEDEAKRRLQQFGPT